MDKWTLYSNRRYYTISMADNVNIIVQDTINDIVVNAAVIVETIDINVQVAVDEVQIIANPNNYVVNINRIIGEQVQSDWDQADDQAPDYIKNKPTIPTATSDLTNDGEDGINPFITAADVTAQVNSDWNAVSGVAEILNKPTIPAAVTKTSDLTNDGEDGINPFITAADVPANGLPAGGTAGQILTKVDATDYNATWQENYADWTSVVKHTVKNNGLSGTITKGTAVYVTSSNGTNMLVGRASNASEPTSSKTMGLMQSDITTTGGNQTGFVITEGLLGGLNTAGQTAGDPVWLGVNGALIYGLTNKPYAPAHLVFIGIVTKISAGNGEIWVKVQNGFELKEIHDVDLITTTPINGHLLGFDGTLWVNKTIATWLGFTPFQLPALTSGSVLFSNGTTIAQKNASFFWDDTNNRLGIGTATPAATLQVVGGDVIIDNNKGYLAKITSGSTLSLLKFDASNNCLIGSNFQGGATNIYATTNTLFYSYPSSVLTERMRIVGSSGSVLIGTTTDAGYKLDVNGTARVSGNTTITPAALTGTAATSALDIAQTWNTTGTPTAFKLNVTNTASSTLSYLLDLQINGSSLFRVQRQGRCEFSSRIVDQNNLLGVVSVSTSVAGNEEVFFSSRILNPTSGGRTIFSAGGGFNPTSGTANFNGVTFTTTINQTGGANGITRGLYINPTLTAAADFRAIEVANGITVLAASVTARASLRIPSGTAPTTPTNGDIWFDGTDLKIRVAGVTKTFTLL